MSPGEMLAADFLKPLGMSNYRLAKEIGVPAQRIGEILAGKRAITADTDLRLCRFFGLSDGCWLRLQADYDTKSAKATLAKTLAKIKPWKEAADQTAGAPANGVPMKSVATAFWRRLDVPGRDAARISETATGYELLGQSVFMDLRGPTALRYRLELTPTWSTRKGYVTGFIGERTVDSHIVRTPNGWALEGKDFGMADVADLDLGFTPATNMVQLMRVGLFVGDATNFDVAWLEAGGEALVRLPQEYRRTSEFNYDYNSPKSNYQATIVLSPSGFASVYPDLWEFETDPTAR